MSAPNAPRLPALLVLLVLLLSVGAAGQEKAEIHTSTDPAPGPAAALRVAMAARRAESKAEPGRQRQATIETKRNRVAQRQQEAADEMKRVREQVAAEAGSRTIDGSASGGGGVAANPLCASWAEDGECIRNPQYMFKSCPSACASLVYTDLDDDCGGWATAGECEKNPSFMLEQCNASCITHVRKLLTQPRQLNRNEHTLEDLISEVPGARELQVVWECCGVGRGAAGAREVHVLRGGCGLWLHGRGVWRVDGQGGWAVRLHAPGRAAGGCGAEGRVAQHMYRRGRGHVPQPGMGGSEGVLGRPGTSVRSEWTGLGRGPAGGGGGRGEHLQSSRPGQCVCVGIPGGEVRGGRK